MSRIVVDFKRAADRGLRTLVALVCLAFASSAGGVVGGDSNRIIDHLYGAALVEGNTGWIVGTFGMIARTRDGGVTWQLQKSNTVEHLFDVDFADATHGWAVGRSGLIARTSDAGETWQLQKSGTENHLFSVKAISPQHAVAVGDWGTIVITADGGKTWETKPLDRDVILNAQAWPDKDHGWIVGEAGTLLVTSDGGATWQDQQTGVDKTFFGTCFKDAKQGWIVGLDGVILHTADGGVTWTAQHGNTEVGALEQVGAKAGVDNPSLYDIEIGEKIGFAVGEGGAVFLTEDGGGTWKRATVPPGANLRWMRAVAMSPDAKALLVGANGLTLRGIGSQLSLPGK